MPKKPPKIDVLHNQAALLADEVQTLALGIRDLREHGVQGIVPMDLTEMQEALMLIARDATQAVVVLSGAIEAAVHHEEIVALSQARAQRRTGKDN